MAFLPLSATTPLAQTERRSVGALQQPKSIPTHGLEKALQSFADERDWNQFHKPKNLALALTGEVGELVEIFQWLTDAEAQVVATTPATSRAVRDEIADVLMYLVRLSSVLGVDMNEAVTHKLRSNARKYPAGDSTPHRD